MVGRTLAHYRILRSLGKGGMGEVFAAEDTRLRREVALKVLPEEFATDPDRVARFEREARAVAALNHPAIVTVFSVEEAEGVRFLTMELVDGEPLSHRIPNAGLTIEQILEYAVPLADALSAAHARGIVHRDLKPGNVMVTTDGRVKVLDFGLAKLEAKPDPGARPDDLTEPLTRIGQAVGTVPYMSPEQVTGGEVDGRSDLFSLGLILHEMATGRRVFTGDSSAELISSILRDEPPPLPEVRPELPYHFGRIVSLCTAKKPSRRYQSALDLRNELEQLQTEVRSGVSRPGTAEFAPVRPEGSSPEAPSRGSSAARRRLRPVPALAALAVVTALVFGIWRWVGQGSTTAPRPVQSVAVLPLDNLTGDDDQEYLARGISAGLITQLGELSALRVAGRAEAWSLIDETASSVEIGRRLGVDAVAGGSLQRQGEGLLVGVDLADVVSGEVVWSTTAEGDREALFELQRQIAQKLTRYLSIPISGRERERLTRVPTESRRAYDFYLQGQQFLAEVGSPRSARFAMEVFQRAAELDGEFALAYVGLSEAYWQAYAFENDPEFVERSRTEAERALEIDPELPAAQVALARVHRASGRYAASIAELRPILESHPRPEEAYRELGLSYEAAGELEAAERAFEAAIALRSDHWLPWNTLGAFLQGQGRLPEAREAFARAVELSPPEITKPRENLIAVRVLEGDFAGAIEDYEQLDREPTHPRLASNMATAYFFVGRLAEAERLYRQAVRMAPDDYGQRGNLGDVLVRQGRADEARAEYAAAYELSRQAAARLPDDVRLRLYSALYAAKSGACSEAVTAVERLRAELPETARNVHFVAWIYGICERRDAALAALRTAVELGVAPDLIRAEDEFASLHGDPEFERLLGAAPAAPAN